MSRADAPEVLPDGYRLSFAGAGETLSLITRTVEAERQCCRFLRFQTHGGRLMSDPERRSGATFQFTLPAAPPSGSP